MAVITRPNRGAFGEVPITGSRYQYPHRQKAAGLTVDRPALDDLGFSRPGSLQVAGLSSRRALVAWGSGDLAFHRESHRQRRLLPRLSP